MLNLASDYHLNKGLLKFGSIIQWTVIQILTVQCCVAHTKMLNQESTMEEEKMQQTREKMVVVVVERVQQSSFVLVLLQLVLLQLLQVGDVVQNTHRVVL